MTRKARATGGNRPTARPSGSSTATRDKNSDKKRDREPPAKARGAAEAGPPPKTKPGRVPFPRKNHPPTEAEFLARLPLPLGKRLDGLRAFLKKQNGVSEDLFFYGPKTGWAFRYLRGSSSLATVMLHDERLVGLVALDAAALANVDFTSLSEVAQRAHAQAHGSPSLLWLDLPLDGRGTSDFKTLLKQKLKALPTVAPPPPAAPSPSPPQPPVANGPRRPPPPPPPPRRA